VAVNPLEDKAFFNYTEGTPTQGQKLHASYNLPMNQEVFAALTEALRAGEEVALVTITASTGSTPQRVGAKMLVHADGRTVGTIGGGCYENDAFWKAKEVILARKAQMIRYDLTDDFAEESGLICGGQMDVFIEPVEPAPHVYVFGAGHVGCSLVKMAHEAGFRVHVVDDREKFASAERFPDGVEVVVDAPPAWVEAHPLPPTAYAVIVTRGHRHDLSTLRALVGGRLRYVGLIGSRAKVRRIYDALLEEGVAPERLSTVHAPIGLDLGGVTPQEIAVSILAELIAVKHGRMTAPGQSVVSLRWDGAVPVTVGAADLPDPGR
jgi:xanthine dehydrogenase accessory factor